MDAQPNIKSDWSQVNTKAGSNQNLGTAVFPRAAAFSDGRYIVVYTVSTVSSNVTAVGQIYNADGSVSVSEFELADGLATDITSSPNIVVFNDDT